MTDHVEQAGDDVPPLRAIFLVSQRFHVEAVGRLHGRALDVRLVVAVPVDHDSKSLSEEAQLVATTRGTAGWEALVKGRFVAVFGYPWYASCPGAARVESVDDCRRAIAAARERGGVNDKARVQAWLEEFTQTCTILGGWDDAEVEASEIPREVLLEGTATGLERWLRQRVEVVR